MCDINKQFMFVKIQNSWKYVLDEICEAPYFIESNKE